MYSDDCSKTYRTTYGGSIGGPDQKIFDFQERPSILHRLSGDAEKRFLDLLSRIFYENPTTNATLQEFTPFDNE